jgi:thiosulfate dehydrogenase (quinone) large subunit
MLRNFGSQKNRDIEVAYGLLRATLGLNILMHGVARLLAGAGTFARTLVPMFAGTPLPSWAVYDFGLAVPFIETLLGALLLAGLMTRWALISGCGLLFVLTFGSSLRQDWQTVAVQLFYTAFYTGLLAGIRWNSFSIDMVLQRPSGGCSSCSVSIRSIDGSL